MFQANKYLDFSYVRFRNDVPFRWDHAGSETPMKIFPFCEIGIAGPFPLPTGLRELLGVPFSSFAWRFKSWTYLAQHEENPSTGGAEPLRNTRCAVGDGRCVKRFFHALYRGQKHLPGGCKLSVG